MDKKKIFIIAAVFIISGFCYLIFEKKPDEQSVNSGISGYAYTEESESSVLSVEEGITEAGAGNPDKAEDTVNERGSLLYVHVCGQVNVPGVYRLAAGSRAFEAVEAAGGFSEAADRNIINLAGVVTDGEKLYIPEIGETTESQSADSRVNINSAGKEELMSLKGIGESRAEDIISYREQHGNFKSIEDIMLVPGIKESAYEKIKDDIRV